MYLIPLSNRFIINIIEKIKSAIWDANEPRMTLDKLEPSLIYLKLSIILGADDQVHNQKVGMANLNL